MSPWVSTFKIDQPVQGGFQKRRPYSLQLLTLDFHHHYLVRWYQFKMNDIAEVSSDTQHRTSCGWSSYFVTVPTTPPMSLWRFMYFSSPATCCRKMTPFCKKSIGHFRLTCCGVDSRVPICSVWTHNQDSVGDDGRLIDSNGILWTILQLVKWIVRNMWSQYIAVILDV